MCVRQFSDGPVKAWTAKGILIYVLQKMALLFACRQMVKNMYEIYTYLHFWLLP